MSSNKSTAMQGTSLWQKQPKANAELFALTYGALVGELVRDLESADEIQQQLDTMGHSIGIRCIEELLAKLMMEPNTSGGVSSSPNFVESAELVKLTFRMFLGVVAETAPVSDKPEAAYTCTFAENPLALFVELPAPDDAGAANSGPLTSGGNANANGNGGRLEYSQLLCGIMRGVLEMLQFDVTCRMTASTLFGDDTNTMLVELQQVLQQGAGEDYQEE
jgi:hypothetical protein